MTAHAHAAALAVSLAAHLGLAVVLARLAPGQPQDRAEPRSAIEVEIDVASAGEAGVDLAVKRAAGSHGRAQSRLSEPHQTVAEPGAAEQTVAKASAVAEARHMAALRRAQGQPGARSAWLPGQPAPEAPVPVSLPAPGSGAVVPVTGGTDSALAASGIAGLAQLAPPSAPEAAVPAPDLRAYGVAVRRLIEVHKRYPPRAAQRRQEGVVMLELTIGTRGALIVPPRVFKSSGVALFDEEALRMAAAAAPFPPSGAQEPLTLHVPVHFSMRSRL